MEDKVTEASEADLDRMERAILEAMSDPSRPPEKRSCMHCRAEVVLVPAYGADAPKLWLHAETQDSRCSLFAEPSPIGH
ncbi:hypothetical protein [Mycobacteroides salmoniphilum]|uniref:Uncharacterized protein n=1 Tax=Mycobacteroides salmoniphilum TaxID=404941 RepID=A0A4R8SZS2_9MYCO|nr:hypothetical protein [Mycobacteroides salmoniphilum]TEA09102.1 hypothetical protein CCUG60884_00271 [Mycobacteroides salmoniphilum]